MAQNSLPFEVYGNIDIVINKKPICITFGNFDGVHLGHKYLIDHIKTTVQDIPIVIVTFNPHSSDFFTPDAPKMLLTNLKDKISLLLNNGASTVIVQKFTEEFSTLSADDFCEKWLKANFNICYVILGHDFCYGRKRQGNFSHMKEFGERQGWHVSQISAFKTHINNNHPISSSIIRSEIASGNIENVERLLGRPYALSGIVIHGDHRGRALGFPTANIKLDYNYAIPQYGVYACYVEIEDSMHLLPAVMNCGVRPSVGTGLKLQIEAHILNFNEDIYGKFIKFHIKKRLRGEMKFANLDQLKLQITDDILNTKKYFMLNL